jgi:uncharacterized protein (TIGR02217 family)
MPFYNAPRFPDTIAFGAVGGPEYSTSIPESFSGDEQRNQQWTYPRHRYELGLVIRNDADTRELYAFFNAIAKGRVNGFRFKDFGAGEALGITEPIGVGTGSSAAYQLIKRYTSGALTFDRIITKIVAASVTIFVAGVPTGSYSLDYNTGIVTINATAAAAITASYGFDVPVRFTSDRLPIRRIDGGFEWGSIELIETRDIT